MIYFDHAAAASVIPELRNIYAELIDEFSGNPEAAHQQGRQLRKKLDSLQRRIFAALLPQVTESEQSIIFSSDTAELLNAVGIMAGGQKKTLWLSPLDHPSVRAMGQRCFGNVEKFPLDNYGRICALPNTSAGAGDLAIISAVQSEIGLRQDLAEVITRIRQESPETVILVDGVQFAAFHAITPDMPLPDLLLISGSKLGAGSGAALLAMGSKSGIWRRKFAESRHKDYLTGRTDAVQAAALTYAVEYTLRTRDDAVKQLETLNQMLRKELENKLLPNGQNLRLTLPAELSAVNILHMLLPGYQSGVLVRMFSNENIMLASGSACESESGEPSAALTALGYNRKDSYSGLRLSLAKENTPEECRIFVQTLDRILKNY